MRKIPTSAHNLLRGLEQNLKTSQDENVPQMKEETIAP
jgi:hypothetical protein